VRNSWLPSLTQRNAPTEDHQQRRIQLE